MNIIFVSDVAHKHAPDCMERRSQPSCHEQKWESYSLFFGFLDHFTQPAVPRLKEVVVLPRLGRYTVSEVEWTLGAAIVFLHKAGA